MPIARLRRALTLAALVVSPAAAQGAGAGTLVVVNKADATASLIDLASGDPYATIPTGDAPHEVAVSPDGRWAVISNYGSNEAPGSTLSVIDLKAAKAQETIHLLPHRHPHGLAWLPDGQHLVVTTEQDSAVLIVSVFTGAVDAVIHTSQNTSHMVVLSPDAKRAYVANIGSSSVTMIDLTSDRAVWTTPLPDGPEGMDVSPDGSELWIASRKANRITVVGAQKLDTLATVKASEFPIRVKFTPDGSRVLVTLARSSELKIFDAKSRKEIKTIKLKVERSIKTGSRQAEGYESSTVPIGLVISPDGKTAFVANTGYDVVTMIDIDKGDVTGYLPSGREPDGLAISSLKK